jgi:hypothetical protein
LCEPVSIVKFPTSPGSSLYKILWIIDRQKLFLHCHILIVTETNELEVLNPESNLLLSFSSYLYIMRKCEKLLAVICFGELINLNSFIFAKDLHKAGVDY